MLSEIQVRRLYIDDIEWERTSESWKDMKPNRDFNSFSDFDESVEDYYFRLKKRFGIPKEVLEQWLYGLYYNRNTVNNYGWIDFDRVKISLEDISLEQIAEIRVIDDYKSYVDEGSSFLAYEQLQCIDKDKEHWKSQGTWRVPPVILDVTSFPDNAIPEYSDVSSNMQLIEGHSRLGYLRAIINSNLLVAKKHQAYFVRYQNLTNTSRLNKGYS